MTSFHLSWVRCDWSQPRRTGSFHSDETSDMNAALGQAYNNTKSSINVVRNQHYINYENVNDSTRTMITFTDWTRVNSRYEIDRGHEILCTDHNFCTQQVNERMTLRVTAVVKVDLRIRWHYRLWATKSKDVGHRTTKSAENSLLGNTNWLFPFNHDSSWM